MKKVLFTFMMFFISVVLFFVMAEVGFRLFKPAYIPLSSVTREARTSLFKPNRVSRNTSSVDGEFDVEVRINKFGYRGDDFNKEPSEKIIRLMVIGDSYTFGVGAANDQTIPAVLEENLKKSGYDVEVINAGVGHESPICHLRNLKYIHLQYKPDAVVLLLDMTDLNDDYSHEKRALMDKDGDPYRFSSSYEYGELDWWRFCINHSAFCKYLHNKVVRTYGKIKALGFRGYIKAKLSGKKAKSVIANKKELKSDADPIQYDHLFFMRGKEKEADIRRHWQRSAKYLNRIKSILDEHGIPFVLGMYPHGIYVGDDQWGEGRKYWGFQQNKTYTDYLPFNIVSDYANSEKIPFINALNSFVVAPKDVKYFYDYDGHMTPAGYKIVAETISKDSNLLNILDNLAENKGIANE